VTGKKIFTLGGHAEFVASTAFDSTGKRLVTTSGDKTLKVWDTASGKNTFTIAGCNSAMFPARFWPNRSQFAAGDVAAVKDHPEKLIGEVKFFDLTTGKRTTTLRGHTDAVLSLAYSFDGKQMASGSIDGTVILWDPESGKARRTLEAYENEIFDLSFSPDGFYLATASRDPVVKIWETNSGRQILALKSEQQRILSLSYSPNGKLLASAGNRYVQNGPGWLGEASIWDAKTGNSLAKIGDSTTGIYSLAFSPDGKHLATAHGDGTVKIWEVAKLLKH
jgi:WD40 repeat protein